MIIIPAKRHFDVQNRIYEYRGEGEGNVGFPISLNICYGIYSKYKLLYEHFISYPMNGENYHRVELHRDNVWIRKVHKFWVVLGSHDPDKVPDDAGIDFKMGKDVTNPTFYIVRYADFIDGIYGWGK